ncbi:MAG: hypothetical protein K2X55_24370 [Burkholderiaceae bacterium]|nr:hypothetical protein [Burkholderiaceae bacterium]
MTSPFIVMRKLIQNISDHVRETHGNPVRLRRFKLIGWRKESNHYSDCTAPCSALDNLVRKATMGCRKDSCVNE